MAERTVEQVFWGLVPNEDGTARLSLTAMDGDEAMWTDITPETAAELAGALIAWAVGS